MVSDRGTLDLLVLLRLLIRLELALEDELLYLHLLMINHVLEAFDLGTVVFKIKLALVLEIF